MPPWTTCGTRCSEVDVSAFLQQLPEAPPKGLLAWAEDTQVEELGGEYTAFHNERIETPPGMQNLMDNRTTGRKVWATFCTCTACGEEWVTKRGTTPESFWIVAGEDGGTYTADIGDDVGAYGMYYQEIGEWDRIVCPGCGWETTVLHQKSVRGGRTKRLQVAQLLNIGKYTTILYWMVEKTISEYGTCLGAVPRYAYAIDEKGTVKAFSHKEGGGAFCQERQSRWHRLSDSADRWNAQYSDWGSINNRKAGTEIWEKFPKQEEMVGTTGEKTGLWNYWKANGYAPATYLKLWRAAPGIENLANAGFGGLIAKIIHGSMTARYDLMAEARQVLDLTKRKPHEMLQVSRADYKSLPKNISKKQLLILRGYREIGGQLPPDVVWEKLKNVPAETLFAQISTHGGSLEKYEHYLEKQRLHLKDIQLLADARALAQALHPETPLTEEELWPRNLVAVHDRLTRQRLLAIDPKKNQDLQAGFDAVLERFAEIQWTDKELAVILPKSNLELVMEGSTLNHCVGGYGGSHAKGKRIILFIRHYRRPERSYYTLNISFEGDRPREIQLHGYGNERHGPHKQYQHTIPKKVRAFVDRWETEVLAPWWARQLKEQQKEKSA